MELQLGQKVNYVRVAHDNLGNSQNVEGEGYVAGMFLSADRRMQVRVISEGAQYNIDLPAINATPTGKKKYFDHILAVQKRAEEINAEVKSMVAKGNAEIEGMNAAYLGAPIEVDIQLLQIGKAS
jgi:hypothetical protein